jgi:hypothetical protein
VSGEGHDGAGDGVVLNRGRRREYRGAIAGPHDINLDMYGFRPGGTEEVDPDGEGLHALRSRVLHRRREYAGDGATLKSSEGASSQRSGNEGSCRGAREDRLQRRLHCSFRRGSAQDLRHLERSRGLAAEGGVDLGEGVD